DALGPFEEALMEGLARSQHVIEAKGVCLLCLGGAMRERKGRGGAGGRKHSSQSVHVFSSLFNSPTPPAGDDDQRPAYASPFPGSPTPYPSARRRKASSVSGSSGIPSAARRSASAHSRSPGAMTLPPARAGEPRSAAR